MASRISLRTLLALVAVGPVLGPVGCEKAAPQASGPTATGAVGPPPATGGGPRASLGSPALGLTTAEHFAVLEEDIAALEAAVQDPTSFGAQRKMLRTQALALAVYAQIGIDEGNGESTKKLSLARNGALAFASAAEGGNREEAVKAAALAKGFRTATAESQPRSISIPLNRIIPLTNLMEQAELIGATMGEDEGASPADWAQPKNHDPMLRNTWRMAALVRAMAPHTPVSDPNPKKNQTRKLWQDTLADCNGELNLLLAAVRSNDQPAYAAHYKALDAACNRCHTAYRVE